MSASILDLLFAVLYWPVHAVIYLETIRRERLRRRIDTWTQPPHWFLQPLACLFLTILPVKYQTVASKTHLAQDRLLFVVNHQALALELPSVLLTIYLATGRLPRGIMDRIHPKIPLWADLLVFFGGIEGDVDSVSAAMRRSQPLVVFPGGHHEVYRKKADPRYSLYWRNRSGFARLAVEHGYGIVPVSGIGIGDMLETAADIPFPNLILRHVFRDDRAPMTVPLCYPKSYETQYMRFGNIIPTGHLSGESNNGDEVWKIREQARNDVLSGLNVMIEYRRSDAQDRAAAHGLWQRIKDLCHGNNQAFVRTIVA
ncbi:hypothetical protein DFJ77DRAFT_459022 [Powellomyces hirtus]|nr:hypothetical protein DFJ77DRAFT_459022 [Powellomyces hirtus]